ncbi:3-hydroxyisobutyrate dehydrogenase [Beijerinckia sp. L45]|uniref:3-hydroxyisobutyrate dehydrogenase n=1 Tax=Beijerinckia sp. L45 TaxID=1641855 RepID=UPI00131E0340|nr:3-hydroxyisobutyrate dehydrogenase [Beijerinckia sp. L45]
MTKIAVIGLGNMGLPMSRNLLKAGHEVTGFDVSEKARDAAQASGLAVAASVTEAVEGKDVCISMLPNGALVTAVWAEAVKAVAPGTLMIDSSTIDVVSARRAHALASAAGLLSLDSPVSGGTEGAEAATLTFMVGGEAAAFERARPILTQMGRKVVHCGPAGNGQAAKICNNMILGISMIAVSEAFNLAEQVGLSHQALFDVASTASGQCYALTVHCPVPGPVPTSASNRGYRPGFAAELMLKDLGLSQSVAASAAVGTPLGALATDIFSRFVESGGRGRDYSAVVEFLKPLIPPTG